jgi:acyl-CoA synthetase (AMP-forming)/AMP-acid ligase II/acyl carrier protein
VVLDRETALDGRRIAEALERVGATFVQATPTTWGLLVESGWQGLSGLKIVCGGEALPRALANELVTRGAELWHMYGPTETTVWSSSLRLQAGEGPPPIGGPLANTRFYVVDPNLEPVPLGVPGELLIGGVGVARGYRNLPELTAERFVPDPFRGEGERVYRTGDQVRLRSDGTLEFLGRLDQQVKLRGFRIELEEVEAVLDRHPDVRTSVAAVREDANGERLLVGYVVLEAASAVTTEALRRYLAASLPAYMVPAVVLPLDELPVTANGKLDRAALPAPGITRAAALADQYVAPQSPLEEQLADIWASLLPVDRIGVDDDFFDLGGHSMLALRLVARIYEAFGVDLFLTAVFEHPTVRGLAEVVTERMLEETSADGLEELLDELEAAEA